MIVTTKNAEVELQKDIQKFSLSKPEQRCFHIQLSKLENIGDNFFEIFLQYMERVPNSYTAQIYICHDNDIYILMHGFMQRQFLSLIKDIGAVTQINDLENIINVSEIGKNFQRLKQDVILKSERKTRANDKQLKIIMDEQNNYNQLAAEILSTQDYKKIENIQQIRTQRDSPLVLVVDDDHVTRVLVQNVLHPKYHTVFATHGEEAINFYIEMAPDIVFLDIGLPDIHGHQVMEILSQVDPDNNIIMFSGRKDKANMLRGLRLGASGFVGKPFSRDQLVYYIEKSPLVRAKT